MPWCSTVPTSSPTQPSLSPKFKHAGGRAVDAHLVLDGGDLDVVLLAEPAVGRHAQARHDEQRQALGAGLGAVDAREHQVHHVVGEVVIATRDEDLGAADVVGAVGVLAARWSVAAPTSLPACGSVRHIVPPQTARGHLVGVLVLLLGRAALEDHLGGRVGQAGVHRERGVGTGQHLLDAGLQRKRRALAALFGRRADALPAGLVQLLPRVLEAGGRLHAAVLDATALAVTDRVERSETLLDEAVRLVEHHLDLLGAPLCVSLLGKQLVELELLEQEELEVAQVCFVPIDGLRHRLLLL